MADSSPPTSTVDSAATTGHLSIGEVLALLLEEFPDVTISKIRFLESQGLIDPERTASGYRKFYANDVDLLRCILREQRENYLPLRVIKDRIDAGEIDPTNENPRPRGIKNVTEPPAVPEPARHPSAGRSSPSQADEPARNEQDDVGPTGAAALFMRTDGPQNPSGDGDAPDPAPSKKTADTPPDEASTSTSTSTSTSASSPAAAVPAAPSGELRTADELCELAGLTREELDGLQSYGVVSSESVGGDEMYDDDAVEIATISKRFLDAGVDARHLRGWRVAAEREAGLLEQLIQPLLRQRNPEARARAVAQLAKLEDDGGKLRTAMMQSALRHHTTR